MSFDFLSSLPRNAKTSINRREEFEVAFPVSLYKLLAAHPFLKLHSHFAFVASV